MPRYVPTPRCTLLRSHASRRTQPRQTPASPTLTFPPWSTPTSSPKSQLQKGVSKSPPRWLWTQCRGSGSVMSATLRGLMTRSGELRGLRATSLRIMPRLGLVTTSRGNGNPMPASIITALARAGRTPPLSILETLPQSLSRTGDGGHKHPACRLPPRRAQLSNCILQFVHYSTLSVHVSGADVFYITVHIWQRRPGLTRPVLSRLRARVLTQVNCE